jgi:hypothetical protein
VFDSERNAEVAMKTGQREFEVRLPVGYRDTAGNFHRRAVLRKMRGHEEAVLYDPDLSGGALVTALLTGCLVRLGELSVGGPGDGLRPLFGGPEFPAAGTAPDHPRRPNAGGLFLPRMRCPGIGGGRPRGVLPVRLMEEGEPPPEIHLTLEDGYTDRNGAHHTELTLTLPRGVDEEFVAPMVAKDPLKGQDALLLRCIRKFGELPRATLEAYGVKILRDLTLGDRRRLQRAFNNGTPGVDFMRQVSCGACGTDFSGLLDVSHFFVEG